MQQQEQKKESVQVNTSPDTTNQDAPLLPRLYLFYEFQTRNHVEITNMTHGAYKDDFCQKLLNLEKMQDDWLGEYSHPSKFSSFAQYRKYFTPGNSDSKNNILLIKSLYSNLKDSMPNQAYAPLLSMKTELNLTYSTMSKIVDMILFGLSYFITDWTSTRKLTELMTKAKTWNSYCSRNHQIVAFFEDLQTTKVLNILLSQVFDKSGDIFINLDRVLLFYCFYDILFPFVLKVKFDLNIPQLNKLYFKQQYKKELYKDPYPVIGKISTCFIKFFTSNFLLSQKICNSLIEGKELFLEIDQIDSYLLEISNLFYKELGIQDIERNLYNILYYSHFFCITSFCELTAKINSLDSLLFQNIMLMFFQCLNQNSLIMKINLDLFPKELNGPINLRKIFANKLFFDKRKINEIDNFYFEDFYNFNYFHKYNWNNQNKVNFISDDKILDYLYPDFQLNLVHLIVLLESNSQCTHLSLVLNLPNFLKKKYPYIYSVVYFIYNVFLLLERQKYKIKLNYLRIKSDTEVPSYHFEERKVILSNVKIQNLVLKIKKLSHFVDLNTVPYENLSFLQLSKLSYEDLHFLTEGLKKKVSKNCMLQIMKISMLCEMFVNFQDINAFFRAAIPLFLNDIKFKIPNELSYQELKSLIEAVTNGVTYCPYTNKSLNVHIYIDIDDLERENIFNERKAYYKENKMNNNDCNYPLFNDISQTIKECFEFEKLNQNTLACYNIKNIQWSKITSGGLIQVKIYKLQIKNGGIKDPVILTAKLLKGKNPKIAPESFLQVSSSIISFLIKPISTINLNFHLKKNK